MPIPQRYSPPNHAKSCPYCRLHTAMARRDDPAEAPAPEPHGTPAPVVGLLRKIGRLVGKRS